MSRHSCPKKLLNQKQETYEWMYNRNDDIRLQTSDFG